MNLERLAANARAVRAHRRMTQQQLAEAAGVHRLTVVRLEDAKGEPNRSTLEAVAEALQVSPEVLLGSELFLPMQELSQ